MPARRARRSSQCCRGGSCIIRCIIPPIMPGPRWPIMPPPSRPALSPIPIPVPGTSGPACASRESSSAHPDAGRDPLIDGLGNVMGRDRRGTGRLLVGSHSETQPHGGWLDGALGVVYALELARVFAADPALAGLGIEAVAWADEEGHYGNMLGSRSFTRGLSEAEIDAADTRQARTLPPP